MGEGAVLIGGAPSSRPARGGEDGEDGAGENKDGDGGPHGEQVCRRLFLLVETQAIYRNKVSLNSLSLAILTFTQKLSLSLPD